MCGRYSGQWKMLAVSLSAVALYYGTDFVIPGFHQHTMLALAYKTPVAVTKGVTDEENAIRVYQRCVLLRVSVVLAFSFWLNFL